MQSMHRSRSLLMELLIVILFLAIASGILVQLFAASWNISRESRRTQAAMMLARDALECFTAGQEIPAEYSETAGGEIYTVNIESRIETAGAGEIEYCEARVSAAGETYARLETARYMQGGGSDEA